MVNPVAVAHQSVRDAAEIEEAIPVGIVARHPGDFQTEHNAGVAECDFCGQACEPRTFGESRARHSQVFVNEDHLFFRPTQLAGFLDQRILPSGGFAVVLDLCGAGLTNVDEGRALGMTGFYFARIIHRSFLSPR